MSNIKNLIRYIMALSIIFMGIKLSAQSAKLPKMGVINIESRGWKEEQPLTQQVRIELQKLNRFEVMDRYDIEDVMRIHNIKMAECLNKECIVEAGKKLNADLMLGGSIESINSKVLIMFREIEVNTGNTLKTITKEFPNGEQILDILIEVTLKEMYGIEITDENKKNLDKINAIPNAVNNAKELTVSIGGPRFGFGVLTGTAAEFMRRPKSEYGYGGYPALFQFGYQFEKMYLNEGDFQLMFEFLPMISGVDQGRFIPSFSFLNGFRSAKTGWEFAFGPTITWTRTADSYKDNQGQWQLLSDYNPYKMDSTGKTIYTPIPYAVESRNDTRGEITSKPGILFAAGKTFKSGKLNMPLNFYLIPRKKSLQFGVSYGFNTMRKKTT